MLQWLKLDCKIEGNYIPPFFVGSMLRGTIGHAMKRVVCINPSYRCEGCFAINNCLYYEFYEKKNSFHAYRLGIALKPDNLDFSLYLFEEAIDSIAYILATITKAFEEVGVGKEHIKMQVASIKAGDNLLYDGKKFMTLHKLVPNELEIDSFCQEMTLQFTMPVRIKEHNKLAGKDVALHTLINNIHSRYRQLKGLSAERLSYRVHGEITHSTMKFVEIQRYSNRQKTKMNMGGLKGEMKIIGLDKQSYMYFKIGEIIGVGKQTVFGLGSYIIKEER